MIGKLVDEQYAVKLKVKMKKNKFQKLKLAAILFSVIAILVIVYLFLAHTFGIQSTKSQTKYDSITINIIPEWRVYHKNQNYDIDIGYFQKREKANTLVCTINAITANLTTDPTLEQFMSTTLAGKMFTDSKKDIQFKGQDAWRGSYTFPSKGIEDPAYNNRLLFRYKTLYIDITLSYNTGLDDATKLKCDTDFEIFLGSIQLL